MTLLDRIAECTAHDLDRFVPFHVSGADVGWVRRELLETLSALRDEQGEAPFASTDERAALSTRYATYDDRTAVMAWVVDQLQESGAIPRMGHELYPVVARFGDTPHLALQRAAMPAFGARAFGVHMHGYVRRPDGLHMWIARRSRTKITFPGMLDNMVAGGQPLGLSLADNLVKECAEEADIPEHLARAAVPTGAVSYRLEIDRGLRNDTLFLFDLELPGDFVPRNTDGEVEAFELWPIRDVLERIQQAPDFKFNCNLTLMDFLLRHGVLDATHPEYDAVRAALPTRSLAGEA